MRLTFDNLVLDDRGPVYAQIVRRFELMLAQGVLADGDEAPSRRMLALKLGVNPNTVQRAFAELAQKGLVETPANAKSVVRLSEENRRRIRDELVDEKVGELVRLSRQLGLPYKRLLDRISLAYDSDDTGEGP